MPGPDLSRLSVSRERIERSCNHSRPFNLCHTLPCLAAPSHTKPWPCPGDELNVPATIPDYLYPLPCPTGPHLIAPCRTSPCHTASKPVLGGGVEPPLRPSERLYPKPKPCRAAPYLALPFPAYSGNESNAPATIPSPVAHTKPSPTSPGQTLPYLARVPGS